MSKDKEISFVGQPIFKQILKLIDALNIQSMINKHQSDHYYHQFALWTQQKVYFVTRIKKDAVYTVVEELRKHYRKKGQAKVLSDEIIELEYNPEDENGKKQTKVTQNIRLRKVCYQDEKNRYYEFLTNNFDITAEEVAFLYKKRWALFQIRNLIARQHKFAVKGILPPCGIGKLMLPAIKIGT